MAAIDYFRERASECVYGSMAVFLDTGNACWHISVLSKAKPAAPLHGQTKFTELIVHLNA